MNIATLVRQYAAVFFTAASLITSSLHASQTGAIKPPVDFKKVFKFQATIKQPAAADVSSLVALNTALEPEAEKLNSLWCEYYRISNGGERIKQTKAIFDAMDCVVDRLATQSGKDAYNNKAIAVKGLFLQANRALKLNVQYAFFNAALENHA